MFDPKRNRDDIKNKKIEETSIDKGGTEIESLELDDVCKMIGDLVQISSNSTPGPIIAENTKNEQQKSKNTKKDYTIKSNQPDMNENKFSVTHLLLKSESQETYKKSFFVLSDELKEDDEEMSIKLKREILLNKLLYNKSCLKGKVFSDSLNDNVITEIQMALSPESRKMLIDNNLDFDSHNYCRNLHGFDQENFKISKTISNDIILYVCDNFLKIEDIFPDYSWKPPILDKTENNKISNLNIGKFDLEDIENKVVYEEKKIDSVKMNIKEIISESNLELKGKEEEVSNINDSGLNVLQDFIKSSKNKPVTEKVEKLLKLLGKGNSDEPTNLKLDDNLKAELLKNLKNEFLKEKEILEKQSRDNGEKKTKMKENKHSPPKSTEPIKSIPNNISKINTNIQNKENNRIQTDSDNSITNNFFNSLETRQNKGQKLEKNNNVFNTSNNVVFATSGWGVNQAPLKKPKTNITTKNSKTNLHTQTSNNSKILKNSNDVVVIKSGNMAIKKLKDPSNRNRKNSPNQAPKSKLQQTKEENLKRDKKGWIGDVEMNDDDSDEWMVIK